MELSEFPLATRPVAVEDGKTLVPELLTKPNKSPSPSEQESPKVTEDTPSLTLETEISTPPLAPEVTVTTEQEKLQKRKEELDIQKFQHLSFSNQILESFKAEYKQITCIPSDLRGATFPNSSNLMVIPQNRSSKSKRETTQANRRFSSNATSCLSVWWQKKSNVDGKWQGKWNLLWFVGDGDKADIFFNHLHTKNGKLYSEGISYKFEKLNGKWQGKEKILVGDREVTQETKNTLIIKPDPEQVKNVIGDYGGFGDFDLQKICRGKACNKLTIKEIGRSDFELTKSTTGSSCQSKSLSNWSSNYSDWRTPTINGLFPSNVVGVSYFPRGDSSSINKEMPPSNSPDRYSDVKGCFQFTSGKVTSKVLLKKSKASTKKVARPPRAASRFF